MKKAKKVKEMPKPSHPKVVAMKDAKKPLKKAKKK
jgi:hypothetical protein